MKRDELVERVRRLAPEKGFTLRHAAAIPTVKKALAMLAAEHRVIRPRTGYWKIDGTNQLSERASEANVSTSNLPLETPPPGEEVMQPQPDLSTTDEEFLPSACLSVERQIGEGPESVYVYYHDAHAELARRNGQSEWECKVGWTVGEPDARIIGQGALTCFPRPPIIGLLIRTKDGRSLERILHSALVLAGKRIAGGGGSEWFITSPERIEHWFKAYRENLTLLG